MSTRGKECMGERRGRRDKRPNVGSFQMKSESQRTECEGRGKEWLMETKRGSRALWLSGCSLLSASPFLTRCNFSDTLLLKCKMQSKAFHCDIPPRTLKGKRNLSDLDQLYTSDPKDYSANHM